MVYASYQVVCEKNPCVKFKRCWTPFAPLFESSPKDGGKWWGWDLNIGSNKWMISMRRDLDGTDYILWKCYSQTSLTTAQHVLSTIHIPDDMPKMYLFTWSVYALLNLFTTHGARG